MIFHLAKSNYFISPPETELDNFQKTKQNKLFCVKMSTDNFFFFKEDIVLK